MRNTGQFVAWLSRILPKMTEKALTTRTRIMKVEIDGDDGLVATFSDGTTAGYVVEELLALRPHREISHKSREHNLLQTGN